MIVRADLHIHSCLSPCGSLEMSPRAIARTARERGLSLIAVTDHNIARNAPAVAAACGAEGIDALCGVEVTSAEEVHALAIFGTVEAAVAFGELIYASLEPIPHSASRFGDQVVVDGNEMIVESLDRFLGAPSRFPLSRLGELIHDHGGLFIPAHIDRSIFSVWSQLGFLPDDDYDAVEMVGSGAEIDPRGWTVTCSSDAHFLDAIARRFIAFEAQPGEAPFPALARALASGAIARSGL